MPSSTVWGGLTAAALLTVGYLVYFDLKRQNDPAFRADRKKAEKEWNESKERRRAQKQASASQRPGPFMDISDDFIAELEKQPIPTSRNELEEYLTKNLAVGEQLMMKGPQYFDAAASCFYRAVAVYPDSMQLLAVFESQIPPPVYNLILEKMARDVGVHAEPKIPESKVEEIE